MLFQLHKKTSVKGVFTSQTGILCSLVTLIAACTEPSNLFDSANNNYKFKGIQKATVKTDGSIILEWDKIRIEKSIKYGVFQRGMNEEFDFNNPLELSAIETYKVEKYLLDKKYCFAVRYFIVGVEPDTNNNEICPELPYVENFTGVKTATALGLGSVKLTWDVPSSLNGISSFGIYEGTDFANLRTTVSPQLTETIVTDLPVDATLSLGVRAIDKHGRFDSNTKTISVKVVNNAPLTFKGIESLTQLSPSRVKLTWLPPAGLANEFRIYSVKGVYNTTPTIVYTTPSSVLNGSASSLTLENLGDELAHCFVVRSVSTGGQEDSNTETKCISLADAGAPVFAGAKTVQFASGAAQLTWDAAVGETKEYRIYYANGTTISNFATASYVTVAAPATSGAVYGLPDNNTYAFAVRAVDSRNQIDANTIIRTATAGDLTAPLFLGVVSSSSVSETQINVTFARSTETDMSHYKVLIRRQGIGEYGEHMQVAQVSSGNVTAQIMGLLPATAYDILIKAIDTVGNPSTNSSPLQKSTLDQTPPSFGGVVSAAKKLSDITKMVVSWNPATDASPLFEYRVYYSTQNLSGKSFSRTDTFPKTLAGGQVIQSNSMLIAPNATSVELSGLTTNTTYYFVVRASDTLGNEDANTVQVSALVPDYTAPVSVTGLAFNPVPGVATINRTPYVTGNGISGNIARIYVDGVLANQQEIVGGTFNVQLSLPNSSKVYVVTATQANAEGVESTSAAVGNYNLQVTHLRRC